MSEKQQFDNRNLKAVIDGSRKTREEIAQEVGCDTSSITKYYNGSRYPKTDTIIKLAKLFNCSTDYLLGVSDVATTDKDVQFICEFTGLNEETVYNLNILSEEQYYDAKNYDFYNKYFDFIFNKNIDVINYFTALTKASTALMDLHTTDTPNRDQVTQWCELKENVTFCEFKLTKSFNKSLEEYTKHYLYKCKQKTEEITGKKFKSKLNSLLSQFLNKE